MASTSIRVSVKTWEKLRELSVVTGESMQAIVDRAVEEIRRKEFWERANAAFADLRNDPDSWKLEQEERKAWDITLTDGLKEE